MWLSKSVLHALCGLQGGGTPHIEITKLLQPCHTTLYVTTCTLELKQPCF